MKKKILSEKVQDVLDYVEKEYIKNNGNVFISFSGGKDSTVLRHIILQKFPNIRVVFSNTTNEIKEVLTYVRQHKNVIWVKPKIPFTEVVKKYGFPLVSKEVSQKINELKNTNGLKTLERRMYGKGDNKSGKAPNKWRFLAEQKFEITHKCCSILKKNPLEKWAKENGNPKPIIALMSDESALRKQLSLYGKDDGKKIYPFLRSGWTEQDIWDYAKINKIRFAECYYDRVVNDVFLPAKTRTGCEYCAFGIHLEENNRFKHSMILSPKRHEKMMNLSNNGVTFREVIEMVKQEKLPKPVLDIYGAKIDKYKTLENKKYSWFNLTSTIKTKTCSCGSKNIKFIGKYDMNFWDTPDNNGNKRNIWMKVELMKCNECNKEFWSDTHMFNIKHRITNRLYNYIYENLNRKSMSDIIEETNLSYTRLISILTTFKEVQGIIEKNKVPNI